MVDFNNADNILDQVELAFSKLIGASDYTRDVVRRAAIERWRWDEPETTFTWSQSDDISRNLRAAIVEDGTKVTLEVEVNAWQDQDEGFKRLRYWKHEKVADLRISSDPQQPWRIDSRELFDQLERGFKAVTTWSKDRLKPVPLDLSSSQVG